MMVEYDGHGYAGFQRQSAAPSIQAALETAVTAATASQVTVSGAGRTDAGAHALGQVVSCVVDTRLDDATLLRALNAHLPDDISVTGLDTVDEAFDPRRQASRREYHYLVLTRPSRSPLWRDRAYWVNRPLNVETMRRAAQHLVGIHDFGAFGSPAEPGRSTVRELFEVRIVEDRDFVRFEFEGSSFLQHMIRSITATLIEIGLGRMNPDDALAILESRDRHQAPAAVPAHGLYLVHVTYGPRAIKEGSDE